MGIEITPRELADLLANHHPVRLVDVRQVWENELARLPESLLIPLNELPNRLAEIPKDPASLIVVYCHHGVRSLSAANYLSRLGFTNVRSLAGGIDAWACEIEPTIARY
ncbi:MAG: sulfurtransferase [Gemmataceae bacterium]|nr:sulfurtransferase [Gemmataceae bacterium]